MVQYNLRSLDHLATQNNSTSQNTLIQLVLIGSTIAGLLTLVGCILYDWRQGFPRMIVLRDNLRRLWKKLREMKRKRGKKKGGEKISAEEQPSSSKGMSTFQIEKTITDADVVSVQQTANSTPSLSQQFGNEVHIEDETPQVDFKEMFEKDKKGKDKSKGKSKSKLRDRVKIKKSELQAEVNEEENPCDLSEQIEKSIDLPEQSDI